MCRVMFWHVIEIITKECVTFLYVIEIIIKQFILIFFICSHIILIVTNICIVVT
jgi:hypothetical protein